MTEVLISEELDKKMVPVFSSDEEYERYREEFRSKMEPILIEQRKARAQSEEDVRKKIIF